MKFWLVLTIIATLFYYWHQHAEAKWCSELAVNHMDDRIQFDCID